MIRLPEDCAELSKFPSLEAGAGAVEGEKGDRRARVYKQQEQRYDEDNKKDGTDRPTNRPTTAQLRSAYNLSRSLNRRTGNIGSMMRKPPQHINVLPAHHGTTTMSVEPT